LDKFYNEFIADSSDGRDKSKMKDLPKAERDDDEHTDNSSG